MSEHLSAVSLSLLTYIKNQTVAVATKPGHINVEISVVFLVGGTFTDSLNKFISWFSALLATLNSYTNA